MNQALKQIKRHKQCVDNLTIRRIVSAETIENKTIKRLIATKQLPSVSILVLAFPHAKLSCQISKSNIKQVAPFCRQFFLQSNYISANLLDPLLIDSDIRNLLFEFFVSTLKIQSNSSDQDCRSIQASILTKHIHYCPQA